MRVAIVGCGRIGSKRARALGDSRLVAVADSNPTERGRSPAGLPGCAVARDGGDAIGRHDVDVVIVATTHDALAEVALAARRARQARAGREARRATQPPSWIPLLEASRGGGASSSRSASTTASTRRCGRRRALFDEGRSGPSCYVRGRYGHGGPAGLRARVARGSRRCPGGGELLDQGVHLIDLARWFARRLRGRARAHLRDVLLGHAGRGQRLPAAADGRRAGGLAARELDRVEEPVLVRDLRRGRQAAGRRPGRQLRRRAPDATTACCRRWARPETTIWEYPGEDHSWALEFADVRWLRSDGPPPRPPASRTPSPRFAIVRAGVRVAHGDRMIITRSPLRIIARRRRHRSAVLLPRARRLPDRGGHRQVRLHHAPPDRSCRS